MIVNERPQKRLVYYYTFLCPPLSGAGDESSKEDIYHYYVDLALQFGY